MTSKTELEQLLTSLRQAIKGDQRFFVEAKTDPSFQPLREHVDRLLDELLRESKTRAEETIASAERAIAEMKEWHSQEAAPSSHQTALGAITKARQAYESNSYFGYLDAEAQAAEAEKRARTASEAQRNHLRTTVLKLQLQASQLWHDSRQQHFLDIIEDRPNLREKAERLAYAGLLDLSDIGVRVTTISVEGEPVRWPEREKALEGKEWLFLVEADGKQIKGEDRRLQAKRQEIEDAWENLLKQKMSEAQQEIEQAHPSLWLGVPRKTMSGDFARYKVSHYAPQELTSSLQHAETAWKQAKVESYESLKRAESSLRECLRLGKTAIEKSLAAQEKHEQRMTWVKWSIYLGTGGAIVAGLVWFIVRFWETILLAVCFIIVLILIIVGLKERSG